MGTCRAAIRIALLSGAVLCASSGVAGAASTENYCIRGTGDGLDWDWEVRFISAHAIEIGRCTGTAMAPNGASAAVIRDTLMDEINDACGIVVTATPYAGPDCDPSDPGFTADGYFDFELWLEEKVASPPGPLVEVTPALPVEFNPYIYVDVPEPRATALLAAGCVGLIGFGRRRFGRPDAR
jgi:hypothetical protein